MHNTDSDIEDIPDLLESDIPEAGPSRPLDRPKVPITLLTGYLGAGKSTLLEYILTADHGYRIAVCMNDFGDSTDIEARTLTLTDPVTQTQSTSFLSLPNGCLCCSVKDLGIAAIEDMVAETPAGVDWVIVELTGIADPAPIAKSFWANEEMGDLILDGVVCVVDSRNVIKQLSETRGPDEINECQKQVACADVILLNKTDLVSTSTLHEVENVVRSINPTLRMYKTVHSRVQLEALHDLRAFSADLTGLASLKAEKQTGSHSDHRDESHDHEHDDQQTPGALQHKISSVLVPFPPLSSAQFDRLNTFLESLLWESKILSIPSSAAPKPEAELPHFEILRTKGYIPTLSGTHYVLQGVADLFELNELPADLQTGGKDSQDGKIIFISKGIDDSLRIALLRYLQIAE